MMRQMSFVFLSLWLAASASASTAKCQFERVPAGAQKLGSWIDKSNWLAIENQRLGLLAADVFMPGWRLASVSKGAVAAAKQRSLDDFPAVDPLDGSQRDLGFLLDSRLYVDGLLVLSNGRVLTERYRNGLTVETPRLLLGATRPLLNLLGTIGISQGKLVADKSVSRYLPGQNASTGLRKMSIQRLLEKEERHAWAPDELDAWRQAGGWTSTQAGPGIRGWLSQSGRWDRPLTDSSGAAFEMSPDDDLLAWVLAESNAMPLSQLMCEHLLSRTQREHPVFWVSDSQGVELGAGLGLSLRDFAKLGQLLLDARSGRSRARIPNWFIETLLASSGLRSGEIKGLAKGSEQRYGFVHLGGAPNRIALIGEHGTSLYVDFEKRLVIAFYATRPGGVTPETLALLEYTWKAIDRAMASPEKSRSR